MSTSDIALTISWFPTGIPKGPAIGDPERTTWGAFADVFSYRREGPKDGPCFIPSRFNLAADGRHVRRQSVNLAARTAVALDCEMHKTTGELPPRVADTVRRIQQQGWAAVVYTSYNHKPDAPRYRIVLPLSEEIDYELPTPEVIATTLQLAGVTDTSKYGAASLFYLPSTESDKVDHHETVTIDGVVIDAAWIVEKARALRALRKAEQERIAAVARAEAENRRQAKAAAGFDPNDSLIEMLRAHFDLASVLLSHGYSQLNGKYRHPNSQSGSFGADIKILGGIERVFSHNAGDPLHRDNLPDWCSVIALDAIDATIILDYGGDRTKALADLAQSIGLSKIKQRKAVAALLFRLIREQNDQETIEAAAFAFGTEIGLAHTEVRDVCTWVCNQLIKKAA